MRPGPTDDRPERTGSSGPSPKRATPRVLVIAPTDERREAWTTALRGCDVVCGLTGTFEQGLELLREPTRQGGQRFEIVVLDVPACNPGTLRFIRAAGEHDVPSLIVCPRVSFDEAVEAMRAGACDIISAQLKPRELVRRVRSACAAARGQRTDREGASPPPPHGFAAPAKPARATPIKNLSAEPRTPKDLADELAVSMRHQLDVEALLRQSLEFLLAQGGPTNAAVFLPSTAGDYSLGAYVNYTCPKETGEVLLDHLANVAAPRLDKIAAPLLLTEPAQITQRIGEDVEWMLGNHVLAFACRSEGECLALFMLFRDRATPFGTDFIELCSHFAGHFGAQLARVVRIHHRHLPRDKWGAIGDPHDAEGGGGDSGGMAA